LLEAIFNPSSIAVIGASQDPKKVGHAVLDNLIRFSYKGSIFPVNPAGGEVLGLKAYPALSGIGEKPGLAVIAIPARFVPGALEECSAAGVEAAIILSAGFKEAGRDGTLLEEEVGSEEHTSELQSPTNLVCRLL